MNVKIVQMPVMDNAIEQTFFRTFRVDETSPFNKNLLICVPPTKSRHLIAITPDNIIVDKLKNFEQAKGGIELNELPYLGNCEYKGNDGLLPKS